MHRGAQVLHITTVPLSFYFPVLDGSAWKARPATSEAGIERDFHRVHVEINVAIFVVDTGRRITEFPVKNIIFLCGHSSGA